MPLYENDIAVDMGTSTTLVCSAGKSRIMCEPTVVIVNKTDGTVLKIGEEANKTLGRTPADTAAIHPIAAGVISDYDMAAAMLRELVGRMTSFSLFKPRMLVCVPGSITGVEERATIDAAIEAGAREVFLLENAVATAIGVGVDIGKANGHMVIDIGGGTTEIAIVSMGGVVECESIKIAGNTFDEAIIRYIRNTRQVLIGEKTAEEIKISIGGVLPKADDMEMQVKGRSLLNGLPEVITIKSSELVDVLNEPVQRILESVRAVIERTPPELAGDLVNNDIILSGAGSQLYGIAQLIANITQLHVRPVDEPGTIVAHGARKMLDNLDNMKSGMMNFLRRRQLK